MEAVMKANAATRLMVQCTNERGPFGMGEAPRRCELSSGINPSLFLLLMLLIASQPRVGH